MKNFFKIFIFFIIIFLSPKVFAASYNITNVVEAVPNFGGGTYYAEAPVAVPVPLYQNLGTRYNGTLSYISFFLKNSEWDWDYNTTYTITLNMATEDWRNHFMGPIVQETNDNGSVQSTNAIKYVSGSFRFVSYKTIKFNFKTGSTMGVYTKFTIYSGNVNTTAFTGVSNYNLSNITISTTTTPPTPTPVAPVPTPTPSPGNQDIINNNNQNSQNIINNQTQNTQDIIDNNTQNTSDIIENNNQNTDKLNDSINIGLLTCRHSLNLLNAAAVYSFNSTNWDVSYSGNTLTIQHKTSENNGLPYLYINNFSPGTYIFTGDITGASLAAVGLYINNNYVKMLYNNSTFTITSGDTVTLYFSNSNVSTATYNNLQITKGSTAITYEPYGEDICKSKLDSETDAINGVNDTLKDDNIDNGVGGGFFSDFDDQDFGLSSIITIPLNTIQSLTSKSCVALNVPIPFTNSTVPLPCMTEVYQQNVPTIYNLWKIVSFGIIAYFISIDIFHMVKGFKDPESDKVEVLDL